MGTLNQLLKCTEHNLYNDSNISYLIGRAQVKRYNKLKELGVKNEDNVDELLERYPEAKLNYKSSYDTNFI